VASLVILNYICNVHYYTYFIFTIDLMRTEFKFPHKSRLGARFNIKFLVRGIGATAPKFCSLEKERCIFSSTMAQCISITKFLTDLNETFILLL
jgi:hypothetical protein